MGEGQAQLYCACSRARHQAQPLCAWLIAAILNCSAVCSPNKRGPELQCRVPPWFLTKSSAVKCPVEASVSGSLWESKAPWSTKEKEKRLDFILLPRFYFYFLGIVYGLCWWPNDFPERLCQFIFLASSPGLFFFSSTFLILAILIGVTWYLIVLLMFIFLIATNVEHLFTCLLVTHISSLVKCLHVLYPLSDWIIF